MKKYLSILVMLFFVLGCTQQAKNKTVLAKVNNYEISKEEFEEEFLASSFSRNDTPQARNEFLNNLINQKLILQDAENKGLDKDKKFLKIIEKFWEQSLLKIALDKKTREVAGSAKVSDKDIEEVYQQMVNEGKTTKPYNQMYSQIKWEITKVKESQLMNDWISELQKKADIKINQDSLKEK